MYLISEHIKLTVYLIATSYIETFWNIALYVFVFD